MLFNSVMLGKIGISTILAAALALSAVRLPAAPCILSNAPTEKPCAMGCCANKSCCETSDKRTGPSKQPLAKATSNQPNIATLSSNVVLLHHTATDLFVFSSAEYSAHAPPPLALICIRLI